MARARYVGGMVCSVGREDGGKWTNTRRNRQDFDRLWKEMEASRITSGSLGLVTVTLMEPRPR